MDFGTSPTLPADRGEDVSGGLPGMSIEDRTRGFVPRSPASVVTD
jgi:hypothetical protein